MIYFQGKGQDSSPESLLNKGLFYGESPFTSLTFERNKYLLWADHRERLEKSLAFFYPKMDLSKILKEVEDGLQTMKPKDQESYYFRITFFQHLEQSTLNFFIYRKEIEKFSRQVSLGLAIKRKSPGPLPSYVKIGNYVDARFELERVKEIGFDDVLFLSTDELITESSSSNIFFRKGEDIFTPKLNSCILDGITRRRFIEFLEEKEKKNIIYGSYNLADILNADEIWLTNSVKGLRQVVKIEDHKFSIEDSWYKKLDKSFREFVFEQS